MICVCIGRGRHKHMIAEYRHLAEQGVKLVELRADYIRSRLNVSRLVRERPCPCIFTCRREQDGGQWEGTEEARLLALRTAVAEGVDYVDLEDDIAGSIPRFGKTKRVISYHNFRDTPEDLYAIRDRLAALDADVVKIATLTHRPGDNVRMLRMVGDSPVPTIGICMGEIGTPTRILAGKFGAPFTYATLHHERKLAPGQISYKMMRDIYRYESINADTEVYAVIADPVTQSMDPVVHNVGFAHMELNKVLVPFRVPRDELSEFLGDCEELGIRGLSVAIPHKEEILRNLNKADGVVRGIGACNTVVFEGRESVGYNTDYRGFLEALDEVFHESERGMTLAGRTALVLGAGGASKAIVYGLKRRDAEVYISSRTYERALLMAEGSNCRTVQWYERNKIDADIVINATPLGMHPNVDETPMDAKYLKRGIVVVDTVHNPEQTLLIKQAKEQNCRVITGVDMYTRQAALQFQHFTEMDPPIDLMKTAYRRIIGPAKWQD